LGKADGARGQHQRRLNERLPDVEKRHVAAPLLLAVGQLKEAVRAARLGVGRAQLTPDEAIDGGQGRAHQPGQQEVGAHKAHDERQGHERPDANHVNHIEGSGLHQAQAAL
jgi:hypothetical protein